MPVNKKSGFTLIELIIVIAIIAIISWIAIPALLEARIDANEKSAITMLKNIANAQSLFQKETRVDGDGDGVGEYGGFLELSGAMPGRMPNALAKPLLSGVFRVLNENGEASRSGYLFRIYLPSADGSALGESQEGRFVGLGAANEAVEKSWCCYAWPTGHNQSGRRSFFINQEGGVLCCDDSKYSGSGKGPSAYAAFKAKVELAGSVTAPAAVETEGQDGNTWRHVLR